MSEPFEWTSNRPPTPEEQVAIQDVYDLAVGFINDDTSLEEIRAASTGKQRAVAMKFTKHPQHPMKPALRMMIDALVEDQDGIITTEKHLTFTTADLAEYQAILVTKNGRRVLQFPFKHPWEKKPDKDGMGGVRGRPLYRDKDAIYNRETQAAPYEPEWWEEEKPPNDNELT